MKYTVKDIWQAVHNSFKALRKGEFLLRVRADKLVLHIAYLFMLMWITIMLSLKVDQTLTKAGQNKAALEELRIHHAEKEAALVKLKSASAVESSLKAKGSSLTLPEHPATKIEKR